MSDKIREAKKILELYQAFPANDPFNKAKQVALEALDIYQSYLSIQGFPGEKGEYIKDCEKMGDNCGGCKRCPSAQYCFFNTGFDVALRECRLAVIRGDIGIRTEEELFWDIRSYLTLNHYDDYRGLAKKLFSIQQQALRKKMGVER